MRCGVAAAVGRWGAAEMSVLGLRAGLAALCLGLVAVRSGVAAGGFSTAWRWVVPGCGWLLPAPSQSEP